MELGASCPAAQRQPGKPSARDQNPDQAIDVRREGQEAKRVPWIREVDEWFASQVLPYEVTLLRLAHRITGDEEIAREIVHETYALLLKAERWRSIVQPRAYALTAVRRAAVRFSQRARVVPFRTFADMDGVAGRDLGPDAHQLLFAKEQRRILLQIVEELPPRCREVVKLRRFFERSIHSIAQELGITPSVVDKHLARGMAIIAEKLAIRGWRGG